MLEFSKILVPTDFSAHARHAAAMAIDLAKRFRAELHFVHVYQYVTYALPDGYVMYSGPKLGEIMAELEKLLADEQAMAKRAEVTKVVGQLVEGVTATELVHYAREQGCDLIVMGTHGRTGIKHALMGSIAEKVVRTAECPVLTIRKRDDR